MSLLRWRAWTWLIGCLLFLSVGAGAQMESQTWEEEFHDYGELGIQVMTRGNIHNVQQILEDPTVKIFILQVPFEEFDLQAMPALIDWVRQGHALWFYDARYAPYLGMKAYALSAKQFRGKPHVGKLGDRKYNGLACGVLTFSKHPTVTGVGQCTVFLPLLGEDYYSAVAVEGDTEPLLQFAADSPALAALRRVGKGVIIFKPLLWPDSLSGKRFQNNLLDYSAGFGVPGFGGEGRYGEAIGEQAPEVPERNPHYLQPGQTPPPPVRPQLEGGAQNSAAPTPKSAPAPTSEDGRYVYAKSLKDGSTPSAPPPASEPPQRKVDLEESAQFSPALQEAARTPQVSSQPQLTNPPAPAPPASEASAPAAGVDAIYLHNGEIYQGRCNTKSFQLETTSESAEFSPADLTKLTLSRESWGLDKAQTKDGRQLSGYLLTQEIHFLTSDGRQYTWKPEAVREIIFNRP